ncbi:serine hydrolase domain-containing protein [Shinella kummerowiae]|jgi:CubicO group peptidase (beta-lactamase class C family)|nr:serine hydrolase domain-containing protein [Shinella kummerowiae]MCT7664071.1 beta-lactamase family protein [Shinella kummerowiae]
MTINRRETLGLLGAAVALPGAAWSQATENEMEAHLEEALEAGHAPGLVGLLAQGKDVRTIVLGRMAVDGPPMQRDSIFRIASMTKPVTTVATMMLVADGKLKLDEPVDRLLPELVDRKVLRSLDGPVDDTVPARRAITVEDLLTFRAGYGLLLVPPGTYPVQKDIARLGIVGFGPPDPHMPYDGDEWLKRLATLPLFAQPGERWLYTTASNILGVLIARAAGESFGDFLQERIFRPLGMKDTAFHVPQAKIERLVTAYRPKDGSLEVWDEPATGGWSKPPAFEQGDGGLVSTADDYLAFVRMLLAAGEHEGRRLLSAEAVAAMTRDHLTRTQRKDGEIILQEGQGWGYGMSVAVDKTPGGGPAGTIGWSGGFGTKWQSDPARQLTTILLTQRMFDGPKPVTIFNRFEQDARRIAG